MFVRALALAILAASTLVGFTIGSSQTAQADVSFGLYIRDSGLSVNKDPINLAFTGNGTLSSTLTHFADHTGWTDEGGTTMYFQDHGSWEAHQAQRASRCLACTRDHIRFNQSNDAGPLGWGTWTMAAVHFEEITWCGHASKNFDNPRNSIESVFDDTHNTVWDYWGGTATSQQCDSTYVGGDGWIVRADIP